MKIPRGVRSVLWSYEADSLSLSRDKHVIIEQVLNRGCWKDIQWLLKTYSKSDIIGVLKNPSRGSWLPDVLNFWTMIWNVRIPKRIRQAALFNVYPVRNAF